MARNLSDYLDELRGKPEPVRRRVLILATSGLTLVIFFFWLLNFKFAGPLATEAEKVVETVKDQPANVGIADALGRIKAGWSMLIRRLKN